MRSRIEDVAAVAGVSIKTVSRVLNHEPNVREQTRERVLAAVARLGYKPNPSARSLAGQRSYALALVYNNPSRNYLMEIQSGMLDACHVQHYNLILGPVGTGRRTLPDLAAHCGVSIRTLQNGFTQFLQQSPSDYLRNRRLALALAAEGARVGVLDADIYGPSQTMMLGVSGKPESSDGKTMEPKINHGVQVMSIGLLVDNDQAMIWRGPMATQALEQMLRQTNWKDIDYLVVDMPPGTGDIQLTLSQRVPLTGAVIVTTPQDIALLDARKGIKMFEKVGVPLLGVIENMAMHVCTHCGHVEHIFGADGGKHMAADYQLDYLGALPLSMQIREQADSGTPTVVAAPDSEVAAIYKQVARSIAVKIAQQAKDFSSKFPTISVSSNT